MTLLREWLGRLNLDSSRFYLRFLPQIQLYILAAPLSTILVLSVMVGWIVSHQSCEFFKQIVGLVDFSLLQNISSSINHKSPHVSQIVDVSFIFPIIHSIHSRHSAGGGGVLCFVLEKQRTEVTQALPPNA